jgi:GGDEF domain-containing protein
VAALDRLIQAIHELRNEGSTGDPLFLARALEILVKHLGASQATLVMASGTVLETRWWYPEALDEEPPEAIPSFCEWLLDHPDRMLVVRDVKIGPNSREFAELKGFPHKATLGCALRQGETVRALLFVHFERVRSFPRMEFALLEAVAGAMGRVLEIEDLKQSMNRLEDALAITKAVMEDNSTRDPETDLPNLRYLEIWQKTMLASGHRPESLVVAECLLPIRNRKDVARIHKAVEGVRAGDLVLRVASGRFLIIFPHTPHSIAHILLLRFRTQLGSAPMGATLWVPGPGGVGLESCQPRLEAALKESRTMTQPALVWHLPDGLPEEPPLPKRIPPRPSTPQRWEPPLLKTE